MNGSARWAGTTCVVEGCVWWIWNLGNSNGAEECVKHLQGKKGNFEFGFLPSDYITDEE